MRSVCFLFFLSGMVLRGRDLIGEMPALPSGFSGSDSLISASEADDYGEFDFSLGLASLYDTNIAQASGNGPVEIESDWIITPSLHASYLLGGSHFQLGVRAQVAEPLYQERDDYNATNYSVNAFGGYRSRKVVASFTTGLSSDSGVNRLTSDFIEQFSLKSGFLASYRFSGKTSLLASWDQRDTESRTGGYGDTSSLTAGLSGVWQATGRLSIGPGYRYGVRTGNDDQDLMVVGPTLRLDYELSTKVKLRSSFGLDRSDSPFSGTSTQSNWSVALDYRASARWGFRFISIQDTQATFSQGGGFDQSTSYRLTYWRMIRRARLELGLSSEDRSPLDIPLNAIGLRDTQYTTLSAALTLPVFKRQADLTFNVNWRDQSSSDHQYTWDGWQSGVGIKWQF